MAKTITVYGIKNCDTMKKARAWLDRRQQMNSTVSTAASVGISENAA